MNIYDEIVNEIMTYESDFFSASGSEITKIEAEKVASKLIRNAVDEYVDGVRLDHLLGDLRDDENEPRD